MKTQAFRISWLAACAALLALHVSAANVLYMNDGRKQAFKSISWDAAKNEYQVQPVSGGDAPPKLRKSMRNCCDSRELNSTQRAAWGARLHDSVLDASLGWRCIHCRARIREMWRPFD